MNLVKKLLNNPGLIALTVPEEQRELKAVSRMPYKCPAVRLQRSFTMNDHNGRPIRFWRVKAKGHPNNESDLSIEGLKEWGII